MSLRILSTILLEPSQEQLLIKLVEAARSTAPDERTEFFVSSSLVGESLIHPGIHESKSDVHRVDIEVLVREGLLLVLSRSQGSLSFDINPLGYRYYEHLMQQLGEPIERTEKIIMRYISSDIFQKQYPSAYSKWLSAEEILWSPESNRQLSMVGHICREAMQEFTEILVNRAQLPDPPTGKSNTKARLEASLDCCSRRLGKTEKPFLKALVSYWEKVNLLVQRQEHEAQKEGEKLVWEDARRVVFQTLVVMYEVDRALEPSFD